jgi:hypothetical protein
LPPSSSGSTVVTGSKRRQKLVKVGPTKRWPQGHRHLVVPQAKLTDGGDIYVVGQRGKRPGSSAIWAEVYNEDFPENRQWFNLTIGECDELAVMV